MKVVVGSCDKICEKSMIGLEVSEAIVREG